MSQAERLQAIEHELQCLANQFRIAADRSRDHGNRTLENLRRLEAQITRHTDAAKNGYDALDERIDEIYQSLQSITRVIRQTLNSANTTNPHRAKEPAQ